MSLLLVKEVLKPSLRTVDAIMHKFGVGKKDAQKFLNSKFKREQVKGGAKVAAVGGGLWAATNFMKAKLGVYPNVASGSRYSRKGNPDNLPITYGVSKPVSKPKSKGIGTDQGKVNRGGGSRLYKKKGTSAFDKAFRAARNAGKMSFVWQGKRVKTNIANPDKYGKKVSEKIITRGAGKKKKTQTAGLRGYRG